PHTPFLVSRYCSGHHLDLHSFPTRRSSDLSQDISVILRDLMVNYASVPSSYIPLSEWQTETTTFLRTLYTADIAEPTAVDTLARSEEHTSELQSRENLVCRLLLEKKKKRDI